jgi:(E)-4-hydroxy-3-methylbut-2-enyl-diphosphate synthase
MIFRNGEMIRRVPEADIVDALMEELARWEAENAAKLASEGRQPPESGVEGIGRRKLPVIAG